MKRARSRTLSARYLWPRWNALLPSAQMNRSPGVFATRIMERLNQTAPKMRLRFLGSATRARNRFAKAAPISRSSQEACQGRKSKCSFCIMSDTWARFRRATRWQGRRSPPQDSLLTGTLQQEGWASHGGPIDFALEKLGLSRTIGLWVPSFLPALVAAATSDLVASVPPILRLGGCLSLRSARFPYPVEARAGHHPSGVAPTLR